MLRSFPPERNYMLLSLKDVLDARNHYYVHLSHLSNVVGTAVGRYLIHEDDWYASHPPEVPRKTPKPKSPRTLFNSVIRDWSWPCVLVFVNDWQPMKAFRKDPDQMVPRALFLPDGRVVPTCTVMVEEQQISEVPDYHLSFPNTYVGGGYLTYAKVQGRQHLGSIACLVSDGDLVYALASRHVAGAEGRQMFTQIGEKSLLLGTTSRESIEFKPFTEIYRTWSGENLQLRLDAGLIEVADIADWTTQVASIGPMDEWLDFTTDNLTLDFIGENVRAFGAASGELRGTIGALFYRYSSMGGTDYLTDFLIFPRREDRRGTLHGDSGTLWFWEQVDKERDQTRMHMRLRPFAMQWGGQTWMSKGKFNRTGHFALGSSLSMICRELGVTLMRDWNTGLPEYWGAVGHYTIGYFACDGLKGKLKKLMEANQEIVSYPLNSIQSNSKINARGPGGFVPLADVPDRLWAHGKMIRGSADKSNHFADMDKPDPGNGNKNLLQLCKDEDNIDPEFWRGYYERVGDTERGLLPFRVWQFFDEMVDAVKKREIDRFVCAAGICAHYVGDACQPLHISYMYNGEPNSNGKGKRGDGVHSAYEDVMLRQNSAALLTMLEKKLKRVTSVKPPRTGKEAAILTVELMRTTFGIIKPIEIVNAYADKKDLWPLFNIRTVRVMAAGVVTLRAIWTGAWGAGGGEAKSKIAVKRLVAADTKKLMKLYMNKNWMPSKTLKTIDPYLK